MSVPRLYRWLLGLLPRALREPFGEEMAAIFAARLGAARSAPARLRVWGAGLADLLGVVVSERLGRRDASPGAGVLRPEAWLADAGAGVRALRRSPGFTAVAVATVGLGIGAATAVFGVVHALLLRPLPYASPEALVAVWPETNFNTTLLYRVREAVPALETISGVSLWRYTLVDDGLEPMELDGLVVSPEHFGMLGARAALGRTFEPGEEERGRAGVVVLGWDFWQSRYGGDPGIVGRTIRLSGGGYDERLVVGVLPRGHRPIRGEPSVWLPLERPEQGTLATDNTWWVTTRIGRLAPGATRAEAEAQLRRAAPTLQAEVSRTVDAEAARVASVPSLREADTSPSLRRALLVLSCAVGLVVLIACVNVANLMLARGVTRGRELALRRALGASGGRIARQLFVEALLVGIGGAAVGLFLAQGLIASLGAVAPAGLAQLGGVRLDGAVLGFALLLALVSSVLFGTLPALRGGRSLVRDFAAGGQRGPVGGASGGRLSGALVAIEVALAVILVVGSGLMLRTLDNLLGVDTGFETAGVLSLRPNPSGPRYPDAASVQRFYDDVISRIEASPGVAAVGGIQILPVTADNWSFPLYIEGHPVPEGTTPPTHSFRVVTPGYFGTLGVTPLAGRGIEPADGASAEPVVVVNRSFARLFWPDGSAVGRTLRVFTSTGRPLRVVGVVEDVRQFRLDAAAEPEIYVPHAQVSWTTSLNLVVRAADGDPLSIVPAVRAAVRSVDPEVPIARMEPLERVVRQSAGSTRFVALVLVGFGTLALLLGAVGVYGVTAFSVARRLPEFGVRLALGATRFDVVRDALVRGTLPVALGIAAGIAGALASTSLLRSLLFGVGPGDPVTILAASLLLGVVALGAVLAPARRATRADPIAVLRRD